MQFVASETVTVEGDNLTVDLILWRKFRRPTPGLVEHTYFTNPGLAVLGEVLPVGTVFTIPATNIDDVDVESAMITLWD